MDRLRDRDRPSPGNELPDSPICLEARRIRVPSCRTDSVFAVPARTSPAQKMLYHSLKRTVYLNAKPLSSSSSLWPGAAALERRSRVPPLRTAPGE